MVGPVERGRLHVLLGVVGGARQRAALHMLDALLLPVEEWVEPEVFDWYKQVGEEKGIEHVESSPLTRSSYHAEEHV